MPYHFSQDDVAFLHSAEGRAALDRCAGLPLTGTTRISDVAKARQLVGSRYSAAVLETLLLRRKASAKLSGADSWLFTTDSLQQASAHQVATHRARQLVGRDVHDVTCSIGADLVELTKVSARCFGSDIDEVRLAMAQHNCADVGVEPALIRSDALHPVTTDTVVVADPARRDASGNRKWRPADFFPTLDELAETYRGRELVVKAAPGIDPGVAPWATHIEFVSLDGQVREACLRQGPSGPDSLKATVLRSDGTQWTITNAESDDVDSGEPGSWIIDPDGAIVRAGLVRHYAARYELWQLDARIAYLTGDVPPEGVRAFRIIDYGRYSEKQLKSWLRQHEIGVLEILVRGLDVDPDALRRRLKPKGHQGGTFVLTRVGRKAMAYVCHAERT